MENSTHEPNPSSRVEEFMALYSGHQRRLYLYVVALLPGTTDAEDVLQETNLVLWKKFSEYVPDTNFFAWACKITRYEVLKYRERMAKSMPQLDEEVVELIAEEAADDDGLDGLRRRSLRDCMEKLSPPDRELVSDRYGREMSVKAMSAATGRSANALSKSLGRIRRILLRCIERRMAAENADDGEATP